MADSETIKSGDTRQKLSGTLDFTGSTANWLTGCTVLCLMKLKESPFTAYSLSASIVSAAAGTVECPATTSGFPIVIGSYKQNWEVTFSDGNKLSFPHNNYNEVKIIDGLN